MGHTEKIDATETMEKTAQMLATAMIVETMDDDGADREDGGDDGEDSPDAGDGMAETMVMTEHMKPTEPLMKMTSIFAEVFWDVCRSWTL